MIKKQIKNKRKNNQIVDVVFEKRNIISQCILLCDRGK